MSKHYHTVDGEEYSHSHDGGDDPHGHRGTGAPVDRIGESEEFDSVDEPAAVIDEQFQDDVIDTIVDSDEGDLNSALRQAQSDILSKALKTDAKARQEAQEATTLALAAEVRDDLPPEVGVEAEYGMAEAVKHKAQAQSLAEQALKISEAIAEPIMDEDVSRETITEIDVIEDEPKVPPIEEGGATGIEVTENRQYKQKFRMGRR